MNGVAPRAFAGGVAAAVLVGCGGLAPSATEAAPSAIVSGALDGEHGEVAAIGARRQSCSEALVSFCSGTLIAPDVVLTAAHCFEGRAPWEVYEVLFASDTRRAGAAAYVAEVERHPAFDDAAHAADLALLRLATPVAVTPARLPAAGDFSAGVADPVTVVGFGLASASDPASGGLRRVATSTVTRIDATTFTTAPGPGLSCQGDSGGPLYVVGPAGPTLVGVTSAGDPGCRVDATNTRVDAYVADFIQPVLAASPPRAAMGVDPAQLCGATCATNADCPAGLACIPSGASGGFCGIEGLPPGSFGEACLDDGACASGTCARLAPGACRCYAPCTPVAAVGPPTPPGPEDASEAGAPRPAAAAGCAVAPAPDGARATLLAVLAMGAALASRSRSRAEPKRHARRVLNDQNKERTSC